MLHVTVDGGLPKHAESLINEFTVGLVLYSIMIGRLFSDAVLPANFSCIKLYGKVVMNVNVGFRRLGSDLFRGRISHSSGYGPT